MDPGFMSQIRSPSLSPTKEDIGKETDIIFKEWIKILSKPDDITLFKYLLPQCLIDFE